MRGLITRSPLEYPGRSPRLNASHSASTAGALRLAAVARADGSMLDLLTGFVGTWSLAAGEVGSLGPVAYPSSITSGGIAFPAIIPLEVFSQGVTLAAIWQPRQMTRGQGVVNTSQNTTEGANAAKLSTSSASGLFFGTGGNSDLFGPATVIAGHNYAAFASMRPGGPNPRTMLGLVDLGTGQKWFSTATRTSTVTCGSHYSALTYLGGNVDNGRVAAVSITARTISIGEMAAWMDDPWSLWYDSSASASSLLSLGVRTAATRAFGSQINISLGLTPVVATIGLTGSQTASAAGTVSFSTGTNVAISGAASASSAGALKETVTIAISGAASASAAGSVTFAGLNVAISGAASTTAAGTVSVGSSNTFAISGAASASAAGALAVKETIIVLGAASASAAGSVTVHAGASTSVSITGAASSSGAGLVTNQVTVSLSGAQSASAVGVVATPISIPISGAASASAASASVVESIALPGAQSASAAGAVSERVTVALTGAASVTGASAGSSVQVHIVGVASSTASGTIKITAFLPIGGAASFSGAGTVTVTGPPIFAVKVPFGRSAIPLRPRIRRVSQNRI